MGALENRSGITAPYEMNPIKIAKSRPISSTVTLGLAPLVSSLAAMPANAVSMMFQKDQRTDSEKGTEAAAYLQDRVGSGIGRSQGASSLGVPTPNGTAPMVSFNFGEGNGNKSLPAITPPAVQQRTKPVKQATTQALPATPAKSTAKSAKPASQRSTAQPKTALPIPSYGQEMGPIEPKTYVGSGGYSDGSAMYFRDRDLQRQFSDELGENAGQWQVENDGKASIGLSYGPKELLEVEAMKKERDARLAQESALSAGPQARDMSPGSQGAWEKEQATEALIPRSSFFSGMPAYENKRAAIIMQNEKNNAETASGKDTNILNSRIADQNYSLGLKSDSVNQGKLALEGTKVDMDIRKMPFEIDKLKAEALEFGKRGDYYNANASESRAKAATEELNAKLLKMAMSDDPAERKKAAEVTGALGKGGVAKQEKHPVLDSLKAGDIASMTKQDKVYYSKLAYENGDIPLARLLQQSSDTTPE